MSERRSRFDRLYLDHDDPWRFETSAYEREKYLDTLSHVPPRVHRGLELGCSIGVLTALLSERCDDLLAVDVSEVALSRASTRPMPGLVRFQQAEVPKGWPPGSYDLILVSELLYFLTRDEIVEVVGCILQSLTPGGICLVVNWTGPCDGELDGESATELFLLHCRQAGLQLQTQARAASYRIDKVACLV